MVIMPLFIAEKRYRLKNVVNIIVKPLLIAGFGDFERPHGAGAKQISKSQNIEIRNCKFAP
jgi:hypothetical protein